MRRVVTHYPSLKRPFRNLGNIEHSIGLGQVRRCKATRIADGALYGVGIDGIHFGLVLEISDRTRPSRAHESLAVEGQRALERPAIANVDDSIRFAFPLKWPVLANY